MFKRNFLKESAKYKWIKCFPRVICMSKRFSTGLCFTHGVWQSTWYPSRVHWANYKSWDWFSSFIQPAPIAGEWVFSSLSVWTWEKVTNPHFPTSESPFLVFLTFLTLFTSKLIYKWLHQSGINIYSSTLSVLIFVFFWNLV